jgi:hypothetical protein
MSSASTFRIAIDLAEKLVSRVPRVRARDSEDLAYKISMWFFFCKAFKSLQATATLYESGFGEDALVIARTIFELYLQAAYMREAPHERARAFAEFDPVARYAWYKRLKSLNSQELVASIERDPVQLAELEALHNKFQSRYPGIGRGWTGMTIASLARHFGREIEKYYVAYYWIQSNLVHSGVTSVGHYVTPELSELVHNCYPSTDFSETTKTVPIVSTSMLIAVISEVEKALDAELSAEVVRAFAEVAA